MIALFLLKLTAGITLMWLLMPRREVTDGFFRIQMRIVLGTTVLAALLLANTTTWIGTESGQGLTGPAAANLVAKQLKILQIVAAVVAYPGSIFWALGRRGPGNTSIWLLALITVGSLLLHSVNVPNKAGVVLQIISDTASAVILGSMLTGMLLGHWYLTTPSMSIKPLWWFTKALLAGAVLRLLGSGIVIAQQGLPTLDLTHGLWLSLRLLCGILVPIIVAVAVLKILKFRNTQSATGVLFAGLIVVFMGETMGALLEQDTQIPF